MFINDTLWCSTGKNKDTIMQINNNSLKIRFTAVLGASPKPGRYSNMAVDIR